MLNTEAASVEEITEPMRKLSTQGSPRTRWAKAATAPGHSQGGQHHRLDHHGPGGVQVGAEAAVEHNENQAGRADHVGGVIVVKGDSEQAVFSKAHPKGDKDQQGRDGQTVQIPPHQRTQQDHTAHQQQSFIHRSVLLCTGQPQLFYSLELIINITICLL